MRYLANFVEHYEQANTAYKISMAKFSASDEDIDTNKNKKRSRKFKKRENNGNKRRKKSSLYCSLHGENNIYTSGE